MIGEIDRIYSLIERAIDSIFDLDFRVARLDMNVRRARLHRVVNDRVDEFNDRRHVAVSREPIQVQHFFAMLCLAHQRDAKSGRSFLQHALSRVALP